MKKIDIHCHTTNHKLYGLHTDYARIEDILENMQRNEIERTVLVATYFPHKGSGVYNSKLLERIRGHPELIAFGSLNMEDDLKAGLEELECLIRNEKIKGIKLYPGYQEFSPSDEKTFYVYELAEKYNVPVMMHTGSLHCSIRDQYDLECAVIEHRAKDTRCKGIYCIKENLHLSEPRQIKKAAQKFPKVNFIASHMGYPYFDQMIALMRACPNVCTDISGVCKSHKETINFPIRFKDEILLETIQKYIIDNENIGHERIMFGTDFPIQSVRDSINIVEALQINDAQKERIYYKTAARLLKLEGKNEH